MNGFLTCLRLIAVLAPFIGGGCGQGEDRYPLAERMSAFEVEWAKEFPSESSRERALQELDQASLAFLRGDLESAAQQLDLARLTLSARQKDPGYLWGASLQLRLHSRLLDAAADSVAFTLEQKYPVELNSKPSLRVEIQLRHFPSQAEFNQSFPWNGRLPFRRELAFQLLSQKKELQEGDWQLQCTLRAGNEIWARQQRTLSVAHRLYERLQALEEQLGAPSPDQVPSLEQETAGHLLARLQSLQGGEALEVDYPAVVMLRQAEAALQKASAGEPFFGQRRSGSFYLRVPTGSGLRAPVRMYVPALKAGESSRPMVVFLHGAGGSENWAFEGFDRGALLRACKERRWFLLATRSPGFGAPPPLEGILAELRRRYALDPDRVFLIGHSMGAMHVASLLSSMKLPVRAAAMIAGAGVPQERSKPSAPLPLFLATAEKDFARAAVERVAKLLGDRADLQLQYRLYPRLEHLQVVPAAFPDILSLFADTIKN
ncbi:MAG: alpha/beta fold hydrolase [Planctomycetota bacterium]|nr:MAG: alpha/beta fold hydrolase [Planctomycetota bacterium]